MLKLNKLITRPQCIDKYINVSKYLESRLNKVLKDIEKFYYSEFWEQRFKRRIKEEGLEYNPIELDKILGTTSTLLDTNVFKLFDQNKNNKGISSNEMIALNINIGEEQLNDSHIENVIIHEFGHRQYNQNEFQTIEYLNSKVLKSPSPMGLKNEQDQQYFSDKNEIRQRIIPIVKEMYDNNWNSQMAYQLSINLKQDSIYEIYNKESIIYWLDNIL